MKLKEEKLENDLKKSHGDLEQESKILSEKRDRKLEDFNRLREMLHSDPKMLTLKAQMSELNVSELEAKEKIQQVESTLEENLDSLNSLNTELRIKKMYSLNGSQSMEEFMKDEELIIDKAKSKLAQVKGSKEQSYILIEIEFEKARNLMLSEAGNINQFISRKPANIQLYFFVIMFSYANVKK